jgi:hypothetical protein
VLGALRGGLSVLGIVACGTAGGQSVEALHYKPEGRGFYCRWCHTMALGLIQPLTEMGTRNISWGVKAAGA